MKAILEMEMPESCYDCPCYCATFNICNISRCYSTYYKSRHPDCPLEPVIVIDNGYVPADGTKTYTVRVEGRE